MGKRILLAEDNLANVTLFQTMLSKAGYEVDVAPDGMQAATKGSAGGYDLVLMDIGLPSIDGIEAAKRIRAAGQKAPIIALTAENDRAMERACEAAGMNGYLSKPISPVELVKRVTQLVG